MAHRETILDYLQTHQGFYCDDCLSENCDIIPRQTVFQVCTKLYFQGLIERKKTICKGCGGHKKSSSQKGEEADLLQLPLKTDRAELSQQRKRDNNQVNDLDRFVEIDLEFEEFNIQNLFTRFDSYSLGEILKKDKYLKFADTCYKTYSPFMEMKLGAFLGMLKEQGDSYYMQFLNVYGDSAFCKFRMVGKDFSNCKGLYVYKSGGQIKYVGRVKGDYNFYQRINIGYAHLSPKNCYIDGQSTNCHINSIVNSSKGDINLFILPMENDDEIIRTERWLINLIKPEWNISLK